MNWREEAIAKLQDYESMRRAAENLPREIRRLEAEYQAVGSQNLSGTVSAKDVRSREDRMINNLVCRQEMKQLLERTQLWVQMVSAAMGALNPTEKRIMHHLYIRPERGGVEHLCQVLGQEKTSIYRKRDIALRKFTLALYGATESN